MARAEPCVGHSLLPGPYTFTLERIADQLQVDTSDMVVITVNGRSTTGIPQPFRCDSLEFLDRNGAIHSHTKEVRDKLREDVCWGLYNALADPSDHISRVDGVFSRLVECKFLKSQVPNGASDCVCDLLRRLPATVMDLPDLPSNLDPAYSCTVISEDVDLDVSEWRNLKVATYVTTNVIRMAYFALGYHGSTGSLRDFVNTIADLLSTASRLSSSAGCEDGKKIWFLVRAFLWTSWQRTSMLYLYTELNSRAIKGFSETRYNDMVLRQFFVAPNISIEELSKRYACRAKPAYMCGWAFELLRAHPSAIGHDFRRFFMRYSDVFGTRPGRCIVDYQGSCAGDEPEECQRFKGMTIVNQSAHDNSCQIECGRLVWDQVSYRSLSGARAVELVDSHTQTRLTYCQASSQTLAITHVWSHGQGGRPEAGHGFNKCLHQRYVRIARSLGCDAYWMDTPCIPEDHQLRREAIENINKVFGQAKAVVVIDRDLMDIDATDLSIKVRETILLTAMVCDWNLRAWTFLEAFRGRSNMQILCKGDVIVSLKESVEMVYRMGSIDIALFLHTIPHLLPPERRAFKGAVRPHGINGFAEIETGSSYLSHRAASRRGDDVVIWSLLLGDKVHHDAETFWRSMEGQYLDTSFLVSSAPRLKCPGLRWAPSSPVAQLQKGLFGGPGSRLWDFSFGGASEFGKIEEGGFLANWIVHHLVGGSVGSRALSFTFKTGPDSTDDRCPLNLLRIRKRFLQGYFWGILLRPIYVSSANLDQYENDISKIKGAVCATNKMVTFKKEAGWVRWIWRGVYEWNVSEPLPSSLVGAKALKETLLFV